MNLFTYTTRDRWNRPVRHFDWNAFAMFVFVCTLGSVFLVGAMSGAAETGVKLAHRLLTSF